MSLRILGVLILLTVVAYAPLGRAAFVYEDRQTTTLTEFPDYRGSWTGWRAEMHRWVPEAWRGTTHRGEYGPTPRLLTSLTYRLQDAAGEGPRGFHVLNVAIHVANGALLYAVVTPLGSPVALIAAGLFLLHPINAEAVSYVAARTDLLYATFVLLMLWASARDDWAGLVGAAVAGSVAVLAKESAVVVVGLLPIWLLARGRWSPRWWGPVGLWLIGGVAVVYRLVHVSARAGAAQPWGAIGAYTSAAAHGSLVYAGVQAAALLRLLALVVWPVGFSIDHDFDVVPGALGLCVGGVLVAALAAALVDWRRRRALGWAPFAVLWVLVSLSVRFVLPMPEYLHEQHLYVPLLGVWTGLAVLASRVLNGRRARWGLCPFEDRTDG